MNTKRTIRWSQLRSKPMTPTDSSINPVILDLPSFSTNFPPSSKFELRRENIINTLTTLLSNNVHAVFIEGEEGIGKTTTLAQFARFHNQTAISLFVSATNRLSYDLDLMKDDIARQMNWILRRQPLDLATFDPLLIKSQYGEANRRARRTKQTFYIVIDGLEELPSQERQFVLSALAEALPIGMHSFRFLLSGDQELFQPLLRSGLPTKSFPLTELSLEEVKLLLSDLQLDNLLLTELKTLCRGLPGRLATVRRAIENGESPSIFTATTPGKWSQLFDLDWKQVDEKDDTLLRVLALLVFDKKPHTVNEVCLKLHLEEALVKEKLARVKFLSLEGANLTIRFASSSLATFVAQKLESYREPTQKLLIKRLLASPDSEETLLELPSKLDEVADYTRLLEFLTPEHILQILERTQTLSKVDHTVRIGFQGAQKLGRDSDLLRFGLQQSIVAELAVANVWESEVEALAALGQISSALALANSAVLREDRLMMLTTLVHGIWLKREVVPQELLNDIRLLVENLDFWSLGHRAAAIASKLTFIDPDLATTILRRARLATDDATTERTFVGMSVMALNDIKDERMRDQAMESVALSRKDPSARSALEGIRLLIGKVDAREVLNRLPTTAEVDAKLTVLRHWCAWNGSQQDADLVAHKALEISISASEAKLDAAFFADLSVALWGAPNNQRRSELILALDGISKAAERLGPSIGYVRLQLTIAKSEADLNIEHALDRLNTLATYIEAILDYPTMAEGMALLVAACADIQARNTCSGINELYKASSDSLETVVLELSNETAYHERSLGRVIRALAVGALDKALDYTSLVNTELRRDEIRIRVLQELLKLSISHIGIESCFRVLSSIVDPDNRHEAVLLILERFAVEKDIDLNSLEKLLPLVEMSKYIHESMRACRALVLSLDLVRSIEVKRGDSNTKSLEIQTELIKRWQGIDVGWVKIETGFAITNDLASIDTGAAEKMLSLVDTSKRELQLSGPSGAAAFLACVNLASRALSGLFARKLETANDLKAIEGLLVAVPSNGERSAIWAEIAMRATLSKRSDLANLIVQSHVIPQFEQISDTDKTYKTNLLIRIVPSVYTTQPKTAIHLMSRLDVDDRDLARREIIRFLLFERVPSDPIDAQLLNSIVTSHETLLNVADIVKDVETDWMIYKTIEEVADVITSNANRAIVTQLQKEDIARRLNEVVKAKLPNKRQIVHDGYKLAAQSQLYRFSSVKHSEWKQLIDDVEQLENISDRAYVLQIVALALPSNMSQASSDVLAKSRTLIERVRCSLDRIDRYLGLAEKVYSKNKSMCRDAIAAAANVIKGNNVGNLEQKKQLIDTAYRVDAEYAKELIEQLSDDEAKRAAQSQIRLLEIRAAIAERERDSGEDQALAKVKEADVSRLGSMLLTSLVAGRMQHLHPTQGRRYLELAAPQPLSKSYALMVWYIENAVVRFGATDHAGNFIRPMFDSCLVAANLAGKVAGRSLVRLRAVTENSKEAAASSSFLASQGSRDACIAYVSRWLEQNAGDELLVHDPYFGSADLEWLQLFRVVCPHSKIKVVTSLKTASADYEQEYFDAWASRYDQKPPKVQIFLIGGVRSLKSPIHDRWLLTGASGLRFGTSLNSIGINKASEISQISAEKQQDYRTEIEQYLVREKAEYNGERIRLQSFWL